MANPGKMFEAATNVIKNLTDNQKNPLHVGEVMACWTYLAFVSEIIIYEEVGLNTITDPELKKLYQDGLNTAESHKKQLSNFMQQEGVPLPKTPPEKPKSEPNAIPLGVKFTNEELANTLEINLVVAADMCATFASQCLRTDVGLMLLKFQTDKLSLGFVAKELMQKREWLKTPPYYYPPGAPEQQ